MDFVEGDIRDSALTKKCVKGADFVVHLAALTSVPFSVKNPDLTFEVNVSGSLNLIRASVNEGVERFVFASSCAVFGDPKFLPVNEDAPVNPISPYAESKLIVERSCRGFYDRGLLGSVVLRFFNVFGPRQGSSEYSGVITLFADRCKRGLPLVVYGDGSQTSDFVSVFDVVQGILAALKCSGIDGEVFNIGSGNATSVNLLAKEVMKVAGADFGIKYMDPRAGDIKDSYADISKAKRLLGFEPRVTLHEGLKAIV
ncbi:MAG: GDP-mannose 4,6-dehydratase [Chloroflexi bacterium]|nr:GDP-mannose 4,6-dehydratase [Chloroflexota bacterium]